MSYYHKRDGKVFTLRFFYFCLKCSFVYVLGHLIAPVIAHVFCNHMGFPNFGEIFAYGSPTRYYIVASFAVGLILWLLLLFPLTEPAVFSNDLYYSNN